MQSKNSLMSVPIDRLVVHPDNPNRMSPANFNKLKTNIQRSGHYEPIIVRPCPGREGHFQIINGHHRVRALAQLGSGMADCIEWLVDDEQTRILLATLNRLGGTDQLRKKSYLIKSLSRRLSTRDLAKLLPDTAPALEKLKNLAKTLPKIADSNIAFLNTMVFYLSDEQKQAIDAAISGASEPAARLGAKQKAQALATLAKAYLQSKTPAQL